MLAGAVAIIEDDVISAVPGTPPQHEQSRASSHVDTGQGSDEPIISVAPQTTIWGEVPVFFHCSTKGTRSRANHDGVVVVFRFSTADLTSRKFIWDSVSYVFLYCKRVGRQFPPENLNLWLNISFPNKIPNWPVSEGVGNAMPVRQGLAVVGKVQSVRAAY